MSRHLLRVLVALLTFTIGFIISPIRFKSVVIGHGYVKDGEGAFYAERYTSSYFIDLGRSGALYPTPEKADAVFEARIKEAIIVLERTPKLNKEGIYIGKRAVALFHSKERNQHFICILWTHGKSICDICSSSLRHVLSFEQNQVDY